MPPLPIGLPKEEGGLGERSLRSNCIYLKTLASRGTSTGLSLHPALSHQALAAMESFRESTEIRRIIEDMSKGEYPYPWSRRIQKLMANMSEEELEGYPDPRRVGEVHEYASPYPAPPHARSPLWPPPAHLLGEPITSGLRRWRQRWRGRCGGARQCAPSRRLQRA